MASNLEANFTKLNKDVTSLIARKPHYKVQLKDLKSILDKLQSTVKKIQVMTQHDSIKLKLSIKAVGDLKNEVSTGRDLCHKVSEETNPDPRTGIRFQRLSDSLRGLYAIFEERKKQDKTKSATEMLQNLVDKIEKLLKVKSPYEAVLTIISGKLAYLQKMVKYVHAIEKRNNLNLPIEEVQDFRNVLSLGIIHAEELSKEPNGNKKPDLESQLKVYINFLETQEGQLTPPIK